MRVRHRLLLNIAFGGLAVLGMARSGLAQRVAASERVSRLGEYRGYSAATYDGWKRSSRYIAMRDGVKLAIDIFRPTRQGALHTELLPVVWTHHRYHRANVRNDTLATIVEWTAGLRPLLEHGYVVAAVDTRGGGASFGTQPGFFSPEETRDAYEVTEWLATQPWSTGNIGMYGRSYLGITQYMAASQRPPHLKAIFPEMAVFEWYPFIYPGGIYRDDFFRNWSVLTKTLDESKVFEWNGRRLGAVPRVDEDTSGALLAAALEAHKGNRDIFEMWKGQTFRNSVDPLSKQPIHVERSPATYLDAINRSGVAVYTLGGWLDAFPRDALTWYRNLKVPQKLVIGPWFHSGIAPLDIGAERLRWYDYWLKGIDNGVMKEAPIHYWVMGAPKGTEWRATRNWPPADARPTRYYLGAGPSGSVQSANDGVLDTRAPTGRDIADAYQVDYTASLGKGNRWASTYGGPVGYPDLAPNDRKGLTYTTAPLPADLEVTGHPIVHLWVSSTASDGDFFAFLEEVDPSGKSTYVSEGVLRASHRKLARAPYDNIGLPYHRSYRDDVTPLPRTPVELMFDLLPTAKVFAKGNRVRLTITGADADSHTPPSSTPPTVRVYRDATHASSVMLPIVAPQR